MNEGRADAELARRIEDPFLRRSLTTALHLRRYLPFYVFGTIWIVTLSVFPSIRGTGDDTSGLAATSGFDGTSDLDAGGGTGGADLGAGSGDTSVGGAATAGGAGAGGATAGATASRGQRGGQTATTGATATQGVAAAGDGPPRSIAESVGVALRASGKMRDGRDCAAGVRQIQQSSYATQCTGVYTGNNAGATYHGVTGDKIRLVRRVFPESANSQAADQINKQAGLADDEVADAVRDVFIEYFKKNYELYGREVEIIEWESQNGNSTDEVQGRGREGACADATYIKQELKAFAVVSSSAPFGECAAERKMIVFQTAPYYGESWFKKYHPYGWHYVMECERISYQVAEYLGKRLANKPAKWAGDATYQRSTRKFGMYVPDNDGYQVCGNVIQRESEQRYNSGKFERYNYALDLSRFADQAAQASVQFKAAGVTTIVLTCDPYSVLFLTQAAARQAWFPEWFLIGVAAQDTDVAARLYEQSEVDGHMFGLSQLGATEKILGKTSEPGRVYKLITGKDIPEGTTGSYFNYIHVFNMLQAAGPALTPETIAAGARNIIPSGAPDFALGYWSYADGPDGTPGAGDHTMIDDSREIYWVCKGGNQSCTEPAPDGKTGTFKETYGGKRFRNGEWPAEEPPVYPEG